MGRSLLKIIKIVSNLIMLYIFSTSAWSVTFGYDQSIVMVGERYRVFTNLDASAPANYDVRISTSNSPTASAVKLGGV
jgi:hypothetical protein